MSAHVLLNLLNGLGKREKNARLGFYMDAHVLLNLLNELGKTDKFNNTRARMLDSIHHMALRSL